MKDAIYTIAVFIFMFAAYGFAGWVCWNMKSDDEDDK